MAFKLSLSGKKTLLSAAGMVIGALIPGVPEWVSAHPEETMQGVGFLMLVLRLFTKGAILETATVAAPAVLEGLAEARESKKN